MTGKLNSYGTEEEVLLAFAVEVSQDRDALERYLREYPEYADELVRYSIELLVDAARDDENDTSYEDIEETGSVDRVWQRNGTNATQ